MERLPTRRSRLVQAAVGTSVIILQVMTGLMSVPADLAPHGTVLGMIVRPERTLLPWFLIGLNAVALFLLVRSRAIARWVFAVTLSCLHGVSYMLGCYFLNPYPTLDIAAIPFFAGFYWVLAGWIAVLFCGMKWVTKRLAKT
ncbi:MAG: hypothetical protein KatS3mg016_1361 [Fimbriimonadales bacterium]|nr:MAG: hypothetical protein KatS3mg016_1361 [Fimbriimonadales bacterium]